ncbi:hypothetical protein Hanom_Chr10g00933531 [Helianthus anomalus]
MALAKEMRSERFPLPLHTHHNLRLRSNLEGPAWEDCRYVYNMIKQSPLGYVVSTYVTIYPTLLQEFWGNAETVFSGTNMWIESEVMGFRIILKEENLRDVLQLADHSESTSFRKEIIDETMGNMSYRTPNVSRQISKSGFIPPF